MRIQQLPFLLFIAFFICSCADPTLNRQDAIAYEASPLSGDISRDWERSGYAVIGFTDCNALVQHEVRLCLKKEKIEIGFCGSILQDMIVPSDRACDAIRALRAWPALQKNMSLRLRDF